MRTARRACAGSTPAERLDARARTIAAIRAIGPGARHRERKTLARLYEIPRLRQITGNLVHLDTDYATAVTADDFIAHDVSAATALDAEILAPRKEPEPRRRARTARDDRRDAGASRRTGPTPTRPPSRVAAARAWADTLLPPAFARAGTPHSWRSP